MTLEISFRRLGLLPGFIQTGNGEPRKAHWLGDKRKQTAEPGQEQQPGIPEDRSPKRRDPRGYRDLASLTLGEVDEAFQQYRAQLIPSPTEGWIAKSYFCHLPLKRRADGRPPVIFGRVRSVYPSDGQILNIEELDMYFPRLEAEPDLLHLRDHDLALQKPAQTYCVGVKFHVTESEMADFRAAENIFIERGFAPLYESGYLDILDIEEQNHSTLHWLHVVGSEWFASIPDSIQPEIGEHLRNLVRWGISVFNYHPQRHSLRYLSLNEELDFHYGFTEHFLVAPQNTDQTLRKVEERFNEIFMQGIG